RMARKGKQGRRRGDFEKGDRLARIGALAFIQQRRKFLFFNEGAMRLACEANALMEAHEMRRCIGVNTIAARFQHGAQHGADRTFAIRSSHMKYGREGTLRMTKRFENAPGAIKRQIDQLRMKRRQPFKNDVASGGRVAAHDAEGVATVAGTLALPCFGLRGRCVRSRTSRASVSFILWRCTIMSIMP